MNNAFEITNLKKNYDTFNLQNVTITLPKGYVMGFIGANGAGKSTTINLLLNLAKKDGGDVNIFGKPHTELSNADKEDIGVVLDECCFPETLDKIAIEKMHEKIYKNWDNDKFSALTKHFRLPDKKMIKDYSKGMKMKLMLACALSHGAKLLILDEATSGLDPVIRDEILDIILEFVQNEECSVFLSSHILSDLEKVCDYITFIKDGKIIFSDIKDDILEKYAVLHCKNNDFEAIDKSAVIGYRQNSFSTDALVLRDRVNDSFLLEKASIEDIMLYYTKEAV